jgi:hypothetical protein
MNSGRGQPYSSSSKVCDRSRPSIELSAGFPGWYVCRDKLIWRTLSLTVNEGKNAINDNHMASCAYYERTVNSRMAQYELFIFFLLAQPACTHYHIEVCTEKRNGVDNSTCCTYFPKSTDSEKLEFFGDKSKSRRQIIIKFQKAVRQTVRIVTYIAEKLIILPSTAVFVW